MAQMTAETDYIMKSLNEKCQSIESVILDTADKCKEVVESQANGYTAVSNKASSLIKERKDARRNGDKVQEVASSKLLRKEVRAQLRAFRRGRISKILSEAKGLQHIAGIRQNGRRSLLTSVKDMSGSIQTSRQGIVHAFASFYELLFTGDVASDCGSAPTEFEGCRGEPITAKETEGQLKLMKPGKAADGAGKVAVMLKLAGEHTHAVIADLFNEVIQPGGEAPASWRKTRLNVIIKKGYPQLLENYRPISILPILVKLFSRVLYARIEPFLRKSDSIDQAGFKSGFSCDDHMFTVTMLYEKSQEWGLPFWIAAVDFKKAFHTVEHSYLVPKQYMRVLRNPYKHQTGEVVADRVSRSFDITRGTKQGDPISPPLFNAVLELILSRLKPRWEQKGCGIRLREGCTLTNLRFADDLLLAGASLKEVEQMLLELSWEAGRAGLSLHPTKTKILSNVSKRSGRSARDTIELDFGAVEILGIDKNTEYLGRLIGFRDFHVAEIDQRIAKRWANSISSNQSFAARATHSRNGSSCSTQSSLPVCFMAAAVGR